VAIMFVAVGAHAEEAPAKPAAKPAVTPAAPKAKVLATVGATEITEDKINAILSRYPGMPPARVASARKTLLGRMIQQELMTAYLKTLPCPADKLAAERKKIEDQLKQRNMTLAEVLKRQNMTEADLNTQLGMQVAMQTLQEQALAKDKVDALAKSAPAAYSDGTKLNASHILIMSPMYASQADKDKARKALTEIAKQIADKTVTFADAAKKHSACPSSAKGGDLEQAFTFDKMDPAFSKAAFAMKVGETSGIVESSFGFHLIKVTKRVEGTDKPGSGAGDVAKGMLMAALQADIIRKAAAANPVVIK